VVDDQQVRIEDEAAELEGDGEGDNYEDLSLEDLKEEADRRGLEVEGRSKKAYQDVLREDDARQEGGARPILDGIDEIQESRVETAHDAGLPADVIKPGEPGPMPARSAPVMEGAEMRVDSGH